MSIVPPPPRAIVGRQADLRALKGRLTMHLRAKRSDAAYLNGPLVKNARLKMNLTQRQLGAKCAPLNSGTDLSLRTIKTVESKKGGPVRRSTAAIIAEVLRQPLDGLLALTGDLTPVQPLTVIWGLPGIGKTTLAVALAHDPVIRGLFSDGILWTSVGQSPNPLSVLSAWGREFGLRDLQLETLDTARWRLAATLRDKQALLIIDDVWRPEDARDLLVGGAHGAALVTTRFPLVANTLALTGDDIVELGVLREADAVQLLQKLAPDVFAGQAASARNLARQLGYLPLSLQVAGRLLRAEASKVFGAGQLLGELRDASRLLREVTPLDPTLAGQTTPTVAALLQKSTDLLTAQTKECFAWLAPFVAKPATIDLNVLQAQWTGMADARKMAGMLIDRGLLEVAGDGRFWLHALLAAHARACLPASEERPAYFRHASHYRDLLVRIDRLSNKGAADFREAAVLLEVGWKNIEAGLEWAIHDASTDDQAAMLCVDYFTYGPELLSRRSHPRQMIAWLEAALPHLRRLSDSRVECVVENAYGSAYGGLGDPSRAVGHLTHALQLACDAGDQRSERIAAAGLGVGYRQLGDTRHAIAYLKRSLDVARTLGDRRAQSSALHELGLAYRDSGDLSAALECIRRNLEIARELVDRHAQGKALNEIGVLYRRSGDPGRAIECHQQVLELFRGLKESREEGYTLIGLANASRELYLPRVSREFLEQSIAIFRSCGDRRGEGYAMLNLGTALGDLGEWKQALDYDERSLAIFTEVGDDRGRSDALRSISLDRAALRAEEEARRESQSNPRLSTDDGADRETHGCQTVRTQN